LTLAEGDRGAGGVGEAGEEGVGSGILKVQKGKNYTTSCNILHALSS